MSKATWMSIALIVVFFAGMATAGKSHPPESSVPVAKQSLLDILDDIFTHPICLAPLLVVVTIGLMWGGSHSLVWLKHAQLDIQERIVALERRRVEVEHFRQTVSQTRVFVDATGRSVLVSPQLATRAITHVDVDAEPDSEQLRAARMLANAWHASGPGSDASAWSFGGMLPMEKRVPPDIRVLTVDEARVIEETAQ